VQLLALVLLMVVIGVVAGINYLRKGFIWTARSRAVLVGEAVPVLLLSFVVARHTFSGYSPVVVAGTTLFLFLPLYLLAAIGTAEYWKRRALALYDRRLEELRNRELELLESLHRVERSLERSRDGERTSDGQGEGRRWAKVLEEWLRGDRARARAVKVEEWRKALRRLSEEELVAEARALEARLKLAVAGRERGAEQGRERLRARLAVVQLTLLDRSRPADEASPASGQLKGEGERYRRELAEVRRRIREWEEKRNRAARGEVVLK